MDVSSVHQICQQLISSSIQRCRISDNLCRLSVVLKSSWLSDPPLAQISVSDTGVGSCLEEFQCLKYTLDSASSEQWDGVISLRTTSTSDDEIYHYHLNLKESTSARRLTKLLSSSKNGAKFSGTEVSLSIFGSVDGLVVKLTHFFEKMLILKIPNIAIELVVECSDIAGSQYKNLFPANECITLTSAMSYIESLKSGLEDYVLKHGNISNDICCSCFSTGADLKVGCGVAYCTESPGQVMEAVIIISELSEPTTPSCLRASHAKTEILYFKDFSPCSISQSSLNGLTSIQWKSYGLTLKSIADQDGCASLEWENLPPYTDIDIALHYYHKQQYPSLSF